MIDKEVIHNNQDAFMAWLNDGADIMIGKEISENNWDWGNDQVPGWNDEAAVYVINDEYVKFRMAYAMGDTIQVTDGDSWNDVPYSKPLYNRAPSAYRIKPKELEFEVGDWVVVTQTIYNKQSIKQIYDIPSDGWWTFVNADGSVERQPHGTLEKWKPNKGDLCLFWCDDISKAPIVARFDKINEFGEFLREAYDRCYDSCEPYFGPVPTLLRSGS